jgi:nitrogen-specific signal transduction histidine kinase
VETVAHTIDFEGRRARLVLVSDVTEQRKLEEQLRQAQKLEAIGRLAGGVAHDFNNLLMVISGYAELLIQSLPRGDRRRESSENILRAADRAGDLTRQLLAFSRRQVLRPSVVDLNAVISNLQKMLRRLISEDIELAVSLAPELGRVRIDPGQLEQVLLNLAVNARDAMPRGGKLAIHTANVAPDDARAAPGAQLRPGAYVLLSVADTGVGMDSEVRARLFEPFFTTKRQGRGTGLGLSVVYGIVEQSGGSIQVDSRPGQGTTFRIYLPRVETPLQEPTAATPAPAAQEGSETVLLVEDEEGVRELVAQALRAHGYTVLEASNGQEALELAAGYSGTIHLLLSDIVMPHMNGPELVQRLRPVRHGIKALLISGYAPETVLHPGLLGEGVMLLEKPFSPSRLLARVREILEQTVPGAGDRGV